MVKSKQHKRKVKHQFGNPPHHLKKEPYMPRITFCIPSKNNLRYVKVAIESIRKNAFRKDHYIHILVDSNEDKCYEWLMENKDENTIVKLNESDGMSVYCHHNFVVTALCVFTTGQWSSGLATLP